MYTALLSNPNEQSLRTYFQSTETLAGTYPGPVCDIWDISSNPTTGDIIYQFPSLSQVLGKVIIINKFRDTTATGHNIIILSPAGTTFNLSGSNSLVLALTPQSLQLCFTPLNSVITVFGSGSGLSSITNIDNEGVGVPIKDLINSTATHIYLRSLGAPDGQLSVTGVGNDIRFSTNIEPLIASTIDAGKFTIGAIRNLDNSSTVETDAITSALTLTSQRANLFMNIFTNILIESQTDRIQISPGTFLDLVLGANDLRILNLADATGNNAYSYLLKYNAIDHSVRRVKYPYPSSMRLGIYAAVPNPLNGLDVIAATTSLGNFYLPLTTAPAGINIGDNYRNDPYGTYTFTDNATTILVNDDADYIVSFYIVGLGLLQGTVISQILLNGESIFSSPPALTGLAEMVDATAFPNNPNPVLYPFAGIVCGSATTHIAAGSVLVLAYQTTQNISLTLTSSISITKII